MEQPSVGAHYPRSTGEFQAWFRTDADCLDYLDWVQPAHGTGTGEQVTEHVAGQSEDPPEHRRGLGADHLARQRVQRPDPAHDRIGSAGTAGQLAAWAAANTVIVLPPSLVRGCRPPATRLRYRVAGPGTRTRAGCGAGSGRRHRGRLIRRG